MEVIAEARVRSCVETTLCSRTLFTTSCASVSACVVARYSLRAATSGKAAPSAVT